MNLPAKLKELRQARNLTEEQLAELAGVSIKTYKNYEAGKTVPRIDIFKKIVLALETTADELLGIE